MFVSQPLVIPLFEPSLSLRWTLRVFPIPLAVAFPSASLAAPTPTKSITCALLSTSLTLQSDPPIAILPSFISGSGNSSVPAAPFASCIK